MIRDEDMEALRDRLVDGAVHIALFIADGRARWVIDWPEHFHPDYAGEIAALLRKPGLADHLPNGLSLEDYGAQAAAAYRGGMLRLDRENLSDYFAQPGVQTPDQTDMRRLFEGVLTDRSASARAALAQYFGTSVEAPWTQAQARAAACLPTFLLDFDRRLLRHRLEDRFFENALPPDWTGAMGCFAELVPPEARYWAPSGTAE